MTFEVRPDEVSNSIDRGEVFPAPDALVAEAGAISVVQPQKLLTRDEVDMVGLFPIQPIGDGAVFVDDDLNRLLDRAEDPG